MNIENINKVKDLKRLLDDIEQSPYFGFDCEVSKDFRHGSAVCGFRRKIIDLNLHIRDSMRGLLVNQAEVIKQEIVKELNKLGVEVMPGAEK